MIRHIVMFKLKEFQTPAEKQAKMQEIKDKLEAVNTYANHPEHVAVAKGIIGPVKADRACVDYEIL